MKKWAICMTIAAAVFAAPAWSGERVSKEAYFDTFTGHKYIKINGDTYAEFSKKGRFLKNVPSSLPLLVRGKQIHPVTADSWILYEKYADGCKNYQSLPGKTAHPRGWKAEKFLISLK